MWKAGRHKHQPWARDQQRRLLQVEIEGRRGMDALDIWRIKTLETENANLKPMITKLSLESKVLKGVIELSKHNTSRNIFKYQIVYYFIPQKSAIFWRPGSPSIQL